MAAVGLIDDMTKLEEYLQLTAPSAAEGHIIEMMALAISEYIEKYCDRTFRETSYTEYCDIPEYGVDELCTRHYPITNATLAAMKVYSVAWANGTATTTELDKDEDYWVYADEGIIKFAVKRIQGHKRIKIEYKAGYSSVPDDIQQVCFQWVGRRWKERKIVGITSRTTASGESMSFKDPDLTKEEFMVLDAYRRPEIC